MTEVQKLTVAAVLSLLVGLITGVAGFVYRDSFDSPRLEIELIQYEVTRQQCPVSANNLYRFRTARPLRQYIETVVPWSLARDLQDDQLEYKNVEDLLRLLPQRKIYLEREIPFVDGQIANLRAYLANPNSDTEAAVKDAIAYVAGLKADSEKSDQSIQNLNASFAMDPAQFTKVLLGDLAGRVRSLRQEIDLIPSMVAELDACYRQGVPKALPMVGSDLSQMPNIQFELDLLNAGNTDGQVSHSMKFTANSADKYEINLVGQNPEFNTTTRPTSWARIRAHQIDLLAYTVDRVRNEAAKVQSFYRDLTSEKGIDGTFVIRDIRGKIYTCAVHDLRPTN